MSQKIQFSANNHQIPATSMSSTQIRRQDALPKTGTLQNAIFNSPNFSSIATDEKGVIQIFNVGAERMLGYEAIDVLNKITPAEISDPQELIVRARLLSIELSTPITPGFEALVFKASHGIEDIYELTYIRKDGSRFPAVVSVTALRDVDGGIIGYLLIGTDNTARKQIEAERERLEQLLRDQQFYTRSLIEANVDALMTTDPSGIITDVNKQMEALTGCTRDELNGKPFKQYFTDQERAEMGIKLALSEKKITNYELTVRARDGRETVVSYNATTFYDRDKKLQGVLAVARDITERNRLDQALQEKNIELESAKAVAEKVNTELLTMVAELQSRDREMKLLIRMDDLLQSCTSVADAYKVIAIMARDLFKGQNGSLAILTSHSQQLETVVRWGQDAIMESSFLLKDCWAMRRGQLHEVIDPTTDLLCQHFVHAPVTGTLCLPLMVQGETLGLLTLAGDMGGEHAVSQQQLVVTVGEAIKLSLSNIKLREELREQAIRDPLTGLYNRRYLEESLSRELYRSQRQKTQLCIAMIDLDHFKQVNDTFGHGAGDSVLREVGRILDEHLRNTDISCRYGGDEFLLVLPDSSFEDTCQRLEQIRIFIKKQIIRYGEKYLNPITISIGIASAKECSYVTRDLIRAADEALYLAKQGRNDQIVLQPKNKSIT
jgi:diguanylate cyclase (GGDEF)-like protein/PAS domain S-box-containing protein